MAEDDGDEKTLLTVPKFSSFKSKEHPKDPKELEKRQESHKKRDRDDRSRSHRSDEHRRSRHGSRESHRRKERRRSRSHGRKPAREVSARPDPRADPGPNTNSGTKPSGVPGLFVIDIKGDPLITRYGGIDKSQIPAYYRHGAGRVLGTPGRLIIHRDGARDQFSLRMPGEGSAFAERDGLRSKASRIVPNPIMIRPRKAAINNNDGDDEIDGYLALSSKKRKRQQSDNSSEEDEQQSYRSIQGKAKPQQDSDSEMDSDSDVSLDIPITDQNNPLKWKSMQLSKRVKDSPEDIDAWLELVDHQDALLKAGADIDHAILENEAHSYAEIKVSMLEKALPNTKNLEDRGRVLVYLMREGVKVWNSKTTAKRWSEVLKDEDGDFALWEAYFDFVVSNITTFQYEDIKKILLDRLHQSLSRARKNGLKAEFAEAIHVLLLTTRFVHNAGYKELAVAAWQGLLELNLFRPSNIESEQTALETFRDFWESEIPRIGEAEAKGWKHFVESGSEGDPPEPAADDLANAPASRDAYKSWGYLEQLQAQKARAPARTMDDGTQDDPFRVVMFADIESFVFLIPAAILPELREQLIDAFLLFSGFQPAFRSSHWIETAYRDQFVSSSLASIDLQLVRSAHDSIAEDFQRKEPEFDCKNVHMSVSSGTLFGGARWFQYLVSGPQSSIVEIPWISEILRQIVYMAGMDGLATYYLAMRFSMEPLTIKKTAKALLKRYSTQSEIYNAYALAEFANNEPGVASKVLSSAAQSASLSAKWYRYLFYKSLSWMELEIGNKKVATIRLCSSVDEVLRGTHLDISELGRTTVLKAQQVFTSSFDELLATGDLEGAGTLADCLVLLTYLTAEGYSEPTSMSQGNIATAMNVVETISRDFGSWGHVKSAAHEKVLQFAAQLLYFNASKGPYRRVYMREQLSRFIALFPQNTIFLSLYEWSDASLRVIDETRDLIHEKALTKPYDCVSSRMFAIQHELTHGNINTSKAAFEQAVSSDACKHSPVLWISYVRFCYSEKQLRPKAKDVFYRALRHCPGSKDVIMEAFVTLIRDMESEELREVYHTMASKGLRVHVDLDEFLEKRRTEDSRVKRR